VLDEEGGGSIDGKITSGPLPMEYPFQWECKALKASSWQDTKEAGLYISKPYYAKQFAINQAYLELTNPGIFTALNKDTSELYHELVYFDQPLAQTASDNMVRVIEAIEEQVLLPRAFASRTPMCDFNPANPAACATSDGSDPKKKRHQIFTTMYPRWDCHNISA
jgi:hypothetical protein